MPEVHRILETALHVADVARGLAFYRDLFGFPVFATDDRFAALDVAGPQVLLLSRRGGPPEPVTLLGGVTPPHDGQGRLHLAFAVAAADLDAWRERLAAHGV